MRRVVCATANPHKVEEMTEIFSGLVELLPRPEEVGDIDETGDTLEENACLKARIIAAHVGADAMADDTGLEIEALNGEPGVRSARYAGDTATDELNRALVLQQMDGVANRRARFRTVIAVATPQGDCVTVVGECGGRIAVAECGSNGFGYDSIFIPDDGDGRTFAEMTSEGKNSLSHRSKALSALMEHWR
jgi:XTP/dITP diphosphohydrolase